MSHNARFWILLAVFQVAFGSVVFALTRHYYLAEPADSRDAVAGGLQSLRPWPEGIAGAGPAATGGAVSPAATLTDPAEISRLADEAFGARQYERAADLYERLLTFDPNNVDVYNNLGITLHYAGRSADALQKLNAGVTLNPLHQRSWLTLGFVNSQLGDVQEARTALTHALQAGSDEQIRQSAQSMIDSLP